MEVIVDELRKNDVNIDTTTLSQYIKELLDCHEPLYDEMAVRLNPEDLPGVLKEMNVNNYGWAMAYLTLVYVMNIPEDAKREAVRLAATDMKDMNIIRVEQSLLGRIGRMFLNILLQRIGRVFLNKLTS